MKIIHFTTRLIAGLIISSSLIGTVYAADNASDKRVEEAVARFKAADKNGDGKLTLEEAKSGMPRIAQNFDKLDTEKKGYLTLEQIKAVAAM